MCLFIEVQFKNEIGVTLTKSKLFHFIACIAFVTKQPPYSTICLLLEIWLDAYNHYQMLRWIFCTVLLLVVFFFYPSAFQQWNRGYSDQVKISPLFFLCCIWDQIDSLQQYHYLFLEILLDVLYSLSNAKMNFCTVHFVVVFVFPNAVQKWNRWDF